MSKKNKHKEEKSKKGASGNSDTRSRPKLKRKEYESELEKLQVELVRLQSWVIHTGARIVVVFEGRDERNPSRGRPEQCPVCRAVSGGSEVYLSG